MGIARVNVHGNTTEIMEMVRELRDVRKLTQGKDFDFAYHPRDWNLQTYEPSLPYATFIFYDVRHATFFTLTYSDRLL